MRYGAEHLDFLRTGYRAMQIPELTQAFNSRFGTTLGEGQIKAACQNHGIKCGRKRGNTVGSYRKYTKELAEYLRTNYTRSALRDLTDEFNREFGTAMTTGQIRSFTRRHKVKSGRTGCFEKGQLPWNTGTKGLTGANRGTFKKGNAPPNRKPLGTERKERRRDRHPAFILVKVAEENPHTGAPTRYKHKHVVIWEQANGRVPKGMVVAFIDGNEGNCVIENLMLISRQELLCLNRNHYKELPAEIKPSMLALAKLKVKMFSFGRSNP